MKLYISRNFTEFGPFKVAEVEDFFKRNILKDSDYGRFDTEPHWVPINQVLKLDKISKTAAPVAKKSGKTAKPVKAQAAVDAWEKAAPAKPAKKAAKK